MFCIQTCWPFLNQTVLHMCCFCLKDSLPKKAVIASVTTQSGLKQFANKSHWNLTSFILINRFTYRFLSDPAHVHEAVVAWVEDIMENNFTVCVTQAGRNEMRNGETFATVDWLAYQGAPDGGVSGEMDIPTWWTGTSCRTVSLPSVSSICGTSSSFAVSFN